jgi:hypothetical protein
MMGGSERFMSETTTSLVTILAKNKTLAMSAIREEVLTFTLLMGSDYSTIPVRFISANS